MTTNSKTPATTGSRDSLYAKYLAEDASFHRADLSDEAINALAEYEVLLVRANEVGAFAIGGEYLAHPGINVALMHALNVASKAARAELKAFKRLGELRKLIDERDATI